jgi:hypothetical protein
VDVAVRSLPQKSTHISSIQRQAVCFNAHDTLYLSIDRPDNSGRRSDNVGNRRNTVSECIACPN